eukprot:TRINITY_DN4149_c0_g2_i1.p1 TRINITY_DN4149_c0_g2~~TRINITY_DN4149_c0_g2_i1.p1  ORF type:complete len:350 (-),score=109.12 TRINITY_DN4149_c0_g2_i1:56-1048(-)
MKEIKELITKQGGTIAPFVQSKTNFVICSSDPSTKTSSKSQKLLKAEQLKIPIVSEFFLYDSIGKESLVSPEEYPLEGDSQASPWNLDLICRLDSKDVLEYFNEVVENFENGVGYLVKEVLALPPRRISIPTEEVPITVTQFLDQDYDHGKQVIYFLKDWLVDPPVKSRLFQLHSLHLLILLTELNIYTLDKKLLDLRVYDHLFHFMEVLPSSTVFHAAVTRLLVCIFKQHHFLLQQFLIQDLRLLEYIIKKWTCPPDEGNNLRAHLGTVALAIEEGKKQRKVLRDLMRGMQEQWEEFCGVELELWKEKGLGENVNYPPKPAAKKNLEIS